MANTTGWHYIYQHKEVLWINLKTKSKMIVFYPSHHEALWFGFGAGKLILGYEQGK